MSHEERCFYIYIMTNFTNTTLYTGVTSNLLSRVIQHKEKMNEEFSSKYQLSKLVYFEACETAITALEREKQIKAGSRTKKIQLILTMNPCWKDLFADVCN